MLSSDDFKGLLLNSDYFLCLVYLAVFAFALNYIFKKSSSAIKRIALFALIFKAIAVIINCILIDTYWKTGDSLAYYSEADNFFNLVKNSRSNIKFLFMPLEYYSNQIGSDYALQHSVSGAANESNFMVTRFATVFYFLSGGRFLIINLFFAFIALVGQLKIIEFFSNYYPKVSKAALSLGIIFVPSLLFFASPVYKETLCIALIGVALYLGNLIKTTRKNRKLNILFVIVCTAIIFITKNYIIYALAIAGLFTFFIYHLIRFLRKGFFYRVIFFTFFGILLYLLIYFNEKLDPIVFPVVETLNHQQELYIELEKAKEGDGLSSNFKLADIDFSFSGLMQRIPIALYTCLFRPHLWEITKPILFINAVESVLLFLLVLYILFFRFNSFVKQLSHPLPLYLFIFSLLFFIIVGLTTFNFGTMVRYKNPGLIFFNVFLILCLYDDNKKVKAAI